jgi:hypothetical protein
LASCSKLDGLVRRCLHNAPEDRYPDFQELRRDLLTLARTTAAMPDLDTLEAGATRESCSRSTAPRCWGV